VTVQQPSHEPTPDPITRPISEAEARDLAVEIARDYHARHRTTGADGQPIRPPDFAPEDFTAELRDGRWYLLHAPEGGGWTRVSFVAYGPGPNRDVQVGFDTPPSEPAPP
jgi:hypothetical protein